MKPTKYCGMCDEFIRTRLRECPQCGFDLIRVEPEREKSDDDGVEYGHPRDAMEERRGR